MFACPDQDLNLRVSGREREGQLKVYVTPSIKRILRDLCETQMCSSDAVLKKGCINSEKRTGRILQDVPVVLHKEALQIHNTSECDLCQESVCVKILPGC